jgi:hypothetical protein
MTTWHDHQPYESDYWLAISVGNPEWTATIKRYLEEKHI